jgi:hypothetical protein
MRPQHAFARFAEDSDTRWLFLIALVAVGMLIYFDLGPALAFTDDWMYAWSVQQLSAGHGLRFVPENAAVALFQVLYGTAVTLGHPDQRLLRLAVVPAFLVAAWSLYAISRMIGADRFWSVAAAAGFMSTPLVFSLSASFMTDVVFAALLLAAAVMGVRWVSTGRGVGACLVLATLATLERQVGVLLGLALLAALLKARRHRSVTPREWVGACVLLAVTTLAVLAPLRLTGSAIQGAIVTDLGSRDSILAPVLVASLVPTLGVFALPFLMALLQWSRPQGRAASISVGVIAVALVALVVLFANVYPSAGSGNYFTDRGLGPTTVPGNKVPLFPAPLWGAIEGLMVVAGTASLLSVWRHIRVRQPDPAHVFLAVLALLEYAVLFRLNSFDRYFLPVALPLVPIVAAAASANRRGRGHAWAIAVMLLGLGVSAIGEQDYQAWQVARAAAADQAYERVDPMLVDGGLEANGVHRDIPYFEKTGLATGPLGYTRNPAVAGPARPCIRLYFAAPDPLGPGVAYRSIASGRIVPARVAEYAGTPACNKRT